MFEQLPRTTYLGDEGISNGFGWTINGYIEDVDESQPPLQEDFRFTYDMRLSWKGSKQQSDQAQALKLSKEQLQKVSQKNSSAGLHLSRKAS